MNELAIIGAGNLGSRHLQALARLESPAVVHVVDPSAPSLDRARARFAEVASGSHVELSLHERIDALPRKLDVAIVATTADVRLDVLRVLFGHARVGAVVLEKVVAQSVSGLEAIRAAVDHAKTRAWVNCPRRQWAAYRALAADLSTATSLELSVYGARWGLASNTVHFIDLLTLFGGRPPYTLEHAALAPGTVPTAREGFVDVMGRLTISAGNGRSVDVTSTGDGDSPLVLQLRGSNLHAQIREDHGTIQLARATNGWAFETRPLEVRYQSALTQLVVADLLKSGTCELTPLDESIAQHAPLLAALSRHLEADPCPIT